MCYSVESSLNAWVIANSLALFLFYRNKNYDRWNAGFIAVFTTIQLLEAGIWTTINSGDNYGGLNELLTKIILLVLLLQPLAQSYLGATFTGENILYYMSFVYIGIMIWALFRVGAAPPGAFYTSKGKGGHLVWNDTSSNSFLGGNTWIVPSLYFIGLLLPLYFAKDKRGLPLLIVGIGTAIYSMWMAKGDEFSSLWCYYAVIYALAAVFV